MRRFTLSLLALFTLSACAASPPPEPAAQPAAATAHEAHGGSSGQVLAQAEANNPPVSLDLERSRAIGSSFEAFLSPLQEPGEEEETPGFIPEEFRSTEPSVPRNERPSRGHGVVRFTNDLSRAFVDVQIDGVDASKIVMFHIHCGRPDQLGPIIVDFAQGTNVQEQFADGMFSFEVTNEIIVATAESGEGLIGALTAGCPIVPGLPDRVKTVAGLEYIARQGELYFNLHTAGQVYFGEMRGQLHAIAP